MIGYESAAYQEIVAVYEQHLRPLFYTEDRFWQWATEIVNDKDRYQDAIIDLAIQELYGAD